MTTSDGARSSAVDNALDHPSVARALNTASELASISDPEQLLESAVILARDGIGFARAILFSRDPTLRSVRLRGSWAIAADGTLRDARDLLHECSASEHDALLDIHQRGQLWQLHAPPALDNASWLGEVGMDGSWVVATPVTAEQRLIGILYNGGERNALPDAAKQFEAAVLCGSLGMALLPHLYRLAWRATELPGPRSIFVERVRDAIHETPAARGAVLAQRFAVSPGHLARAFKREVGVSLVEYRQRLLLEQFFAALERGSGRLLDAAIEAGFGSYAQFHRVYRKLMGTAPQQLLSPFEPRLPREAMTLRSTSLTAHVGEPPGDAG